MKYVGLCVAIFENLRKRFEFAPAAAVGRAEDWRKEEMEWNEEREICEMH